MTVQLPWLHQQPASLSARLASPVQLEVAKDAIDSGFMASVCFAKLPLFVAWIGSPTMAALRVESKKSLIGMHPQ